MSRNLSGVYTLPVVYEATPGDTILATQHNTPLEDIQTDLNTPRPVVAGGTGVDTEIEAWDVFAKKGNDIATGSSINLQTATGPLIDLTGTTTVTAVTLSERSLRICRAAAAFQLTASATLVVNGSTSENYTTTAGDLLVFLGYAGSTVRVWSISGGSDTTLADRLTAVEAEVDALEVNQDFAFTVLSDLYGNYLGMARGWSDAFDTESGIDTSASTNESYSSGDDSYSPTTTDTRISGGTPSTLFNGTASSFNDNNSGTTFSCNNLGALNSASVADRRFATIDYGTTKTITQIEAKQYVQASGSTTLNQFYTSLDAVTWTAFGAVFSASTSPVNVTRTGAISARYIALVVEQTGFGAVAISMQDFNGYEPVSNNMTLISNAFAAPANVGMTAAFLDIEFASSLTPGTDFDFAMSANNGSAYSSSGVSYALWYSSGSVKRYTVEGIDLTAQADDAVRARFRTLTNKAIKITGWRPRWKDA